MTYDEFSALLLGHTCNNCGQEKAPASNGELSCWRFLGEAVGWQWWLLPEIRTCKDWAQERIFSLKK